MPPKRSASISGKPTPVKKNKVDQGTEKDDDGPQEYSFKNYEYFAGKATKKWKNLKQILDLQSTLALPAGFESFTYARLDAPPSLKPLQRYCDITGLEANYIDPNTGLRYHSSAVFQYIKSLGPETVQRILQLRNAGTII